MSPAMVRASQLMEQQHYADAAAAWAELVRTEPANAAIASMQTGAAFFFLAQFDQAIAWYRHAGQLGHDAADVQEHVVEAEQARARGNGPASGGQEQIGTVNGQICINIPGHGWHPYTHPRPGESVVAADGGMFTLGNDGRWYPSSNTATAPPQPGHRVLVPRAATFFVLNADGSWTHQP